MFDLLTHADWSIAAGKRWATTARRLDGRWIVDAPRAVVDCDAFVANVVAARSGPDRRLTGFDFPIGVPESYGLRTGFNHFRDLLENAGTGQWSDFFTVATSFNEVSLHRPFYPHRSNNGAKTAHLLEGLGVETIDDLRRRCDLPTPTRRAACALFWTLGPQQVGKAAISGWRDVVRPALAAGACVWPYDGSLSELSASGRPTVCETYPAEAYGHIGFRFGPRESKQRQSDRVSKAARIAEWAETNGVSFSETTSAVVKDGFGCSKAGEDPFDSLVGLLGMIEVVDGRRNEGPVASVPVRLWEGWILGQTPETGSSSA